MSHTHAIHSKYQNQLPLPPPMEYKPASNTRNLNLFHHVLKGRALQRAQKIRLLGLLQRKACEELLLWSDCP